MTQLLSLSESAAYHVKEMMENNGEQGSFLRVSVNGGGCSGLTYGMAFDKEQQDTDQMLELHGIRVVVSSEDTDILAGTEIDYKESLMGGGFTIENPNAIAACGCGTSFRTAKKAGTPASCD